MPERCAPAAGAVVVDADGHVVEPADSWQRYLEPGLFHAAQRLILGENTLRFHGLEAPAH